MASESLTTLLDAASHGDRSAFDRAFTVLYDELSRLARAQRGRWKGNETINTSALLHEAYLKLINADAQWEGRRHFFALAARVMRQVLVNYAEAGRAEKRGGDATHVELADASPHELAARDSEESERILSLHETLTKLAEVDERRARILELRFFAGLSISETAETLGISAATVKREYSAASAWVRQALTEIG